ncbi:hypothetical protein NDA18_000256 [Ustilago nuda]|nr:hypothetical protein NDA18_000256 [Ustilago nuda]
MSAHQETESNIRTAPATVGTAVIPSPSTATTSSASTPTPTPTLTSSYSSNASTQNALPSYSEANVNHSSSASVAGPSSEALPSSGITPGSDSFFDIAPRNDSTSFQVGYLGLKGFQAWLKGDVLVKLDTETKSKGRYTRCLVQLQAKEQVARSQSAIFASSAATRSPQYDVVELFSHTLVLWDADNQPTSSSLSLPTAPSTMPFSFPLTQDLPHCVHLRDSSLTYTITAQLFSEDAGKLPHAIKTVPVHLVRYTRPGPLNEVELADIDGAALPNQEYTLQPHSWIQQAPTLVYAQINRTIFRRAEPIDIRVRIPPPDPTSVSEKGLKLRAVEADLVRIIHVKRPDGAGNHAQGGQTLAEPCASHPDLREALLAHSGKLCRFHSQRPVLLRLTLHPPFDRANMPHPHPDHDALAPGPVFGRGGGGGCESISQETLMHKVSFEVRIKIAIQRGRSERRDITLKCIVKILPGAAGALENLHQEETPASSTLSEKERLKRSEKAPMLAEDEQVAASGSQNAGSNVDHLLDFGMDDEYDGYEDIGRSLNDLIDAANGSDAAASSSEITDHVERLEQLRQFLEVSDPSAHNDGPPPSLLESQNDLQVEVEVEGVGLAMPRQALRHPAEPYPNIDGIDDGSFPPPPPIDDGHSDSRGGTSSYALLPTSSNRALHLPTEHDYDPPPPLSPLVGRSSSRTGQMREHSRDPSAQPLHMPGGFTELHVGSPAELDEDDDNFPLPPPHSSSQSYPANLNVATPSSASIATMQHGHDQDESHPSYEAAVSGDAAHRGAASGRHEPPPYADGSAVPSFDQAMRRTSAGASGAVSVPPSSIQARGALCDPPLPLTLAAHEHSAIQRADHRPPAYGTSLHPPSYDA